MTHRNCGGLVLATDEPPYEHECDIADGTEVFEVPVFRCGVCGAEIEGDWQIEEVEEATR